MKKYQIIYADPPWKYSFSGTRSVRNDDYKTMQTQDICDLNVRGISDENTILFMWMIWNRLPDALKVIDAWGFKYVGSAFTWVKRTKHGKWHYGMGGWTRQNSESCLFAIKGNPKRVDAGVFSVVDDVVMEHSKKPDCVKDRIVRLVGDVPRIELFARQKTEGWDVWGNEVESDINLDHLTK